MVPAEWKPSKEEMKKAEVMDPKSEPQGIMEVCQQKNPLPFSLSPLARHGIMHACQATAALLSCAVRWLAMHMTQGTSARLLNAENSLPVLQAWHHNRRQVFDAHGVARDMLRAACTCSTLLLSVACDTFLRCRCGTTNGARFSVCTALRATCSGWRASSCGCSCA